MLGISELTRRVRSVWARFVSSPSQTPPRLSDSESKNLEILKRDVESLERSVGDIIASMRTIISSLENVNVTMETARISHNTNFKFAQENRARIERLEYLVEAIGIGVAPEKMN